MSLQHNENVCNTSNGAEEANSVKDEFAGVVQHRKDYHFFAVREEYLAVCRECKYKKTGKAKSRASDHCKAIILDILENWTNHKIKHGQCPDIVMTYKQWEDAMYGLYTRLAIIDSLDELIGEGLIKRSDCKLFGKETYQYTLNYKLLNKRLAKLPTQNIIDASQMRWDETASEANLTSEKNGTRIKRDGYPSQMRHIIDINIDSNIDSDRNIVAAHADDAPSLPQEKNKRIKKTELTEEQQDRVHHWQNFINQHRGGSLREKGPRINETTCLQTLVHEYTDEQIEAIHRYCEKHWKYKENPHEIGGRQLLNESRPALALLNKQPAVSDEPSPEEVEAVNLRNQVALDKWLERAAAKGVTL